MVCAKGARDVEFVCGARGRDDGGAEGFCDLDGGETDAAGCGVDEDPVTCRVVSWVSRGVGKGVLSYLF